MGFLGEFGGFFTNIAAETTSQAIFPSPTSTSGSLGALCFLCLASGETSLVGRQDYVHTRGRPGTKPNSYLSLLVVGIDY